MIVDVGRRCRVSDMYFFTTGETVNGEPVVDFTRPTKVRWYNAPPGARQLPFFAFGGADYLSEYEKCMEGFGETVFGQKKWSNGKAPVGATGQHFCGTQADFQIPKVWSPDLPTIERGPTGLPLCCNDALRNAIVWTGDSLDGSLLGNGLGSQGATGGIRGAAGYPSEVCTDKYLPLQAAISLSTSMPSELNGISLVLLYGNTLPISSAWEKSFFVPISKAVDVFVGFTTTMSGIEVFFHVVLRHPFIPGLIYLQTDPAGVFPTPIGCSPSMTFSYTTELLDGSGSPTGNFLTMNFAPA